MFRTKISMYALLRALRAMAVLAAVGLPLGLYFGGAQPIAVGLIPEPWDKLAHTSVFAMLAACVGYASGWRGRAMWWLGFTVALAMGALDEFHQISLPGRSAGWDDLTADAVGSVLGASALRWRRAVECWLERLLVSHL